MVLSDPAGLGEAPAACTLLPGLEQGDAVLLPVRFPLPRSSLKLLGFAAFCFFSCLILGQSGDAVAQLPLEMLGSPSLEVSHSHGCVARGDVGSGTVESVGLGKLGGLFHL